MNEVTIVCCYNDTEQYNNFVNSLKTQTCPYELIGIDNRGNKAFTSCSRAYNSVKDQIKTKYVIYSHQDILLTEPDTIAKFVTYLEKIDADDILGVAGVRFDRPEVFTNIKHRWNSTGEISYASNHRVEGSMMECDTVDECFFGGYSEHFRQNPFDESVCDNYHLYAVEACLNTQSKLHAKVYVCDVQLIHLSSGNTNIDLYRGFYKLCRKYSQHFPFIRTTCASCRTDFIHATSYYLHSCLHCSLVKALIYIGIYSALRRIKQKLLQ